MRVPDRHTDAEPGSAHARGRNVNRYEQALRAAKLLGGPPPAGYGRKWWDNAERRGVSPDVIVDIASQHDITAASFDAVAQLAEITDPGGQSFFVVPPGVSGDDLRAAVLMTYIGNVGSDYGRAVSRNDFPATPYGATEVQRIKNRQDANGWSYAGARAIVNTGGSLVTTPNGMLMGLGGHWMHHQLSRRGGTTFGDVFLVSINNSADPAGQLREIVRSGLVWYQAADGGARPGSLSLDRVLHHEERHAQQWARLGPARMSAGYLAEEARVRIVGGVNRFEEDAGLADGGYR